MVCLDTWELVHSCKMWFMRMCHSYRKCKRMDMGGRSSCRWMSNSLEVLPCATLAVTG